MYSIHVYRIDYARIYIFLFYKWSQILDRMHYLALPCIYLYVCTMHLSWSKSTSLVRMIKISRNLRAHLWLIIKCERIVIRSKYYFISG